MKNDVTISSSLRFRNSINYHAGGWSLWRPYALKSKLRETVYLSRLNIFCYLSFISFLNLLYKYRSKIRSEFRSKTLFFHVHWNNKKMFPNFWYEVITIGTHAKANFRLFGKFGRRNVIIFLKLLFHKNISKQKILVISKKSSSGIEY